MWRGVAPDTVRGTWITFSQAGEADTYTLAARATEVHVYLVKAITPGGSAGPAWAAAERVEELVTDQPLSVAGLMEVRRETVVTLTETDGGEAFQHAGGTYRFTTNRGA